MDNTKTNKWEAKDRNGDRNGCEMEVLRAEVQELTTKLKEAEKRVSMAHQEAEELAKTGAAQPKRLAEQQHSMSPLHLHRAKDGGKLSVKDQLLCEAKFRILDLEQALRKAKK